MVLIRCLFPRAQFAAWVDAVVFVFSLEDEISFQTVYNYFLRLSSYRNTAEVPMVLVGTQGESRPTCSQLHIIKHLSHTNLNTSGSQGKRHAR